MVLPNELIKLISETYLKKNDVIRLSTVNHHFFNQFEIYRNELINDEISAANVRLDAFNPNPLKHSVVINQDGYISFRKEDHEPQLTRDLEITGRRPRAQ